MNLPRIQALIAPLSAPVPSALGVAVQAYQYFLPQSAILGWIAAIGAFAGIEAIGGASCYAVVKLHRQKSYGIEFFVSLAGIAAYVLSGYFVLHTTAIMIFFILAPFSYFAYAILRNMQDEHIEKVSETEAQIRLIEAQTRQINAETRKSRANTAPAQSQSFAPERTAEQPGQESVRSKVFAVLADNPNMGPREMSRTVECSVSTASKWIKEFKGDSSDSK